MKRHTAVSACLNSLVIGLVSIAWIQTVGNRITILDIASFFGVIAVSLMWVHYATEALAPKQDSARDIQYIATRIAVLIAIIAHPLLVNIYLTINGYGAPPDSYEKLVGSVAPVLLGWTALAAFISFELRGKLKQFSRYIFHANIVGMFLILMHGFLIGMVIMTSWFYWVWWVLLVSFIWFALQSYAKYYGGVKNSRFYVAAVLVILLGGVAMLIGFNQRENRSLSDAGTPEYTGSTRVAETEASITNDQLKNNDGKDGSRCWVALDGIIYDATGNPNWVNGEHIHSDGRAKCGKDLSTVISQSPHGRQVLEEIETVGLLVD